MKPKFVLWKDQKNWITFSSLQQVFYLSIISLGENNKESTVVGRSKSLLGSGIWWDRYSVTVNHKHKLIILGIFIFPELISVIYDCFLWDLFLFQPLCSFFQINFQIKNTFYKFNLVCNGCYKLNKTSIWPHRKSKFNKILILTNVIIYHIKRTKIKNFMIISPKISSQRLWQDLICFHDRNT